MPEKFNAARRVRNIVSVARAQSDDTRTLVAWGAAFQTLDLPNPQFETVRLLGLLTEQVNSLAREVEAFGLDQSDYQPTLSNLNSVLMVTNFDFPWRQYRSYLTDEVIRQLGIFAQMSQVDEPIVSLEDIAQLKEDLQNFQREILQSDIDERLRAFVLTQVTILLRGIRDYPILLIHAC